MKEDNQLYGICLWKLAGQEGRFEAREENKTFLPNELETTCCLCPGYGVYAFDNKVYLCEEYARTKRFNRQEPLTCSDSYPEWYQEQGE